MNLKVIHFRNLRVYPFELEMINDIELVQSISKHTRLTLTAVIKEELKDLYVAMTTMDTTVIVQTEGLGEESEILFQGIVTHIAVQVVTGVYHLHVEAADFTCKLALTAQSRSFQQLTQPISEIVKQILAPYENANVIFRIDDTTALTDFLLQYCQTDWNFIVLLASIFHTGIITEPTCAAPQMFFGIIADASPVTLPETNYTTEKRIAQADEGPRHRDGRYFLAYRVQSNILVKMGQKILFCGKTLYVANIVSHLVKGELVHEYTLTDMMGLYQKRIYNDNIIGASIGGEVIDVYGERVKLHLSIDTAQDKEKACWFEYASSYNQGRNSGIYIMPEIGDIARLYFASKYEPNCFVINSVHYQSSHQMKKCDESQYGLERNRWAEPKVKSIKANGKEILIAPDRIIIQATDVIVTWHDEEGLMITTKNNVKIRADEALDISAAEVNIDGEEKIKITCGGSSIKMTPDKVEIKSASVNID